MVSTSPGPEATLQAAGLKLIGTLTKTVSAKEKIAGHDHADHLSSSRLALVVIEALGDVRRDSRVVRFRNGTSILFLDFIAFRVDRKIVGLERDLGC